MSGKIIVIGAGPAGLTAALEFLRRDAGNEVLVLEAEGSIGGLARTIDWNGNRFDIGGHRFFSRDADVERWWRGIMPMRSVERHSSIYFAGKFIDYPIRLSADTVRKLGVRRVMALGWSYLRTRVRKGEIHSLEDFYISRFGEALYRLFFHDYTHKVWGREPARISPDWGPQRIEGISLGRIAAAAILRESPEPSLMERFLFPAEGCGAFWEAAAEQIRQRGGQILLNCKVKGIECRDSRITELLCETPSGAIRASGDVYVSSMPLRDLCLRMTGIPANVAAVASRLRYRDMIVVGALLDGRSVRAEGTYLSACKDQWIYVQDRNVGFGRIQIIGNWSEAMVKDPERHILLALEYFCQEGDDLWRMDEAEWRQTLSKDLTRCGLIRNAQTLLDFQVNRIAKAYPCYWDGYAELHAIEAHLDSIGNLLRIGRNGRHRYSNMDAVVRNAIDVVEAASKC